MKNLFLVEAAKNKDLPIGGGLWTPVLHPEDGLPAHHTQSGPSNRTDHRDAGIHRAEARQTGQHRFNMDVDMPVRESVAWGFTPPVRSPVG